MSNRRLRDRIISALEAYRRRDASLSDLRDAVVLNGNAMEMMPYDLIKEIDGIEYCLSVAVFDDEDDFEPQLDRAFSKLERWLASVPVEDDDDTAA